MWAKFIRDNVIQCHVRLLSNISEYPFLKFFVLIEQTLVFRNELHTDLLESLRWTLSLEITYSIGNFNTDVTGRIEMKLSPAYREESFQIAVFIWFANL